jgi:hypothetical protein
MIRGNLLAGKKGLKARARAGMGDSSLKGSLQAKAERY